MHGGARPPGDARAVVVDRAGERVRVGAGRATVTRRPAGPAAGAEPDRLGAVGARRRPSGRSAFSASAVAVGDLAVLGVEQRRAQRRGHQHGAGERAAPVAGVGERDRVGRWPAPPPGKTMRATAAAVRDRVGAGDAGRVLRRERRVAVGGGAAPPPAPLAAVDGDRASVVASPPPPPQAPSAAREDGGGEHGRMRCGGPSRASVAAAGARSRRSRIPALCGICRVAGPCDGVPSDGLRYSAAINDAESPRERGPGDPEFGANRAVIPCEAQSRQPVS